MLDWVVANFSVIQLPYNYPWSIRIVYCISFYTSSFSLSFPVFLPAHINVRIDELISAKMTNPTPKNCCQNSVFYQSKILIKLFLICMCKFTSLSLFLLSQFDINFQINRRKLTNCEIKSGGWIDFPTEELIPNFVPVFTIISLHGEREDSSTY